MKITTILSIPALLLLLSVCAAADEAPAEPVTYGTEIQRGFTDQHGGGMAFAKDPTIMGWLFEPEYQY